MVRNAHPSLKTIEEAKAQWDREVAAIDLKAQVAKEQAKAPVLAAIRDALSFGVPLNRITQDGLGYSGIQSLGYFVGVKRANMEEITNAVNGGNSFAGASTIGTTVQAGARAADRGKVGPINWELRKSHAPDHMNVWLDHDHAGAFKFELDRIDGKWTPTEPEEHLTMWPRDLADVIEALKQATGGNLVIEND